MNRKGIDRYFRTVERDTEFVNEAISKGARLSLEEWHDFVFKADIATARYDSIAQYSSVYRKYVEMARIESALLDYILTVEVKGFTMRGAKRMVNRILKRFNKLRRFADRLAFSVDDEDGIVYFCVSSANPNNSLESDIVDRSSLCEYFRDLWVMLVRESRLYNKETRGFIEDHLCNEICIIEDGKRPTPYFGCMKSNTLSAVIVEKTEYESCRKHTASAAAKPIIKLTGTDCAVSK